MFTSSKVQENLFAKNINPIICKINFGQCMYFFFFDLACTKRCKICSLLLSLLSNKVISLLTTSFCSMCHISTSNIAQNIDNIDTLLRSSDFSIPKPKVCVWVQFLYFLSIIITWTFNITFQPFFSTYLFKQPLSKTTRLSVFPRKFWT